MGIAKLEQLRNEILANRKGLIAVTTLVLLSWSMTLIGSFVLIRRAMAENRVNISKAVDTPTNVSVLLADQHSGDVLNHIVYFHKVRLESGPSDDVYFAGDEDGQQMLVVAHGSTAPADEGVVNIKGTVRPAPSASVMLKKWNLTKERLKNVQEAGMYLDADSIRLNHPEVERIAKK